MFRMLLPLPPSDQTECLGLMHSMVHINAQGAKIVSMEDGYSENPHACEE